MRIGELVSHDEIYVQPFTSVGAVEGKLEERGYVVVMDQGKFVGVLTAADALSSGHNLVIDCYREKPLIRADEDAELVMSRMLGRGSRYCRSSTARRTTSGACRRARCSNASWTSRNKPPGST